MTLPADAHEWWVFDPIMDRERYVREMLEQYRATPTACGRVQPADHELARRLYQDRIPFTAVEGAFVLAAARRTDRNPASPPLAPIRSLRYFLPILREILDTPMDPGDISYFWHKMLGNH